MGSFIKVEIYTILAKLLFDTAAKSVGILELVGRFVFLAWQGIHYWKGKVTMKYQTRDFGEIEVAEEDVLEFVQPLFGFEEFKKYTIIKNEEFGEQIVWLQCLEAPGVCFILFDPSSLASVFAPQLSQELIAKLGDGDLVCWVIGVVPADFHETTVNLKSPVIIHPKTRKGAQVILEQDYPVRYYLLKKSNG